MADKEKVKAPEKSGAEIFQMTEYIMKNGYSATIDGRKFVIDFERSYDGRRISQFASLTQPVSTPAGVVNKPIKPEVYSLTDLTDQQIHELANAQVISLNKAQRKKYQEWRKNRFPKSDDD